MAMLNSQRVVPLSPSCVSAQAAVDGVGGMGTIHSCCAMNLIAVLHINC